MNRNSEHARQFTHTPHDATPCKYGSEHCNKITDPEHRQNYRHEGLSDFLLPCKYKDQCRDRSTEHLKNFGHPSHSFQKTQKSKSIKLSFMNDFFLIRFKTRNHEYNKSIRIYSTRL